MIDEILIDADEKMTKAIEHTREEFSNIRTGRANVAMFSSIMVEYYGTLTPLQQLASFNIPEARTVIVTPFDKSATNDIIKAIRESDLGVNPTDDGQVIRVALPILTEDRRKEYVKLAKTKAEESSVAVRGIRRKLKDSLDKMKKDGLAGEDEITRGEKELESVTKKYIESIDSILAAKEADLLKI